MTQQMNDILSLARECNIALFRYDDDNKGATHEDVQSFAALIRAQDLARIAELEEALTAIADPDSNHPEIVKFMHSAGACLERVYEDIAEKSLANKSNWLQQRLAEERNRAIQDALEDVAAMVAVNCTMQELVDFLCDRMANKGDE